MDRGKDRRYTELGVTKHHIPTLHSRRTTPIPEPTRIDVTEHDTYCLAAFVTEHDTWPFDATPVSSHRDIDDRTQQTSRIDDTENRPCGTNE
jgi:hypothetical protein